MNRGGVGARSLNIELQAALNPAGDQKVERFGWTFAPSDKVIQIENDYDEEVYNGDIGYIDDVDLTACEPAVSFDGRGPQRRSPSGAETRVSLGAMGAAWLVPFCMATATVFICPFLQF